MLSYPTVASTVLDGRGGVVILPSTLTDLVAYEDLMVRNMVKNRHSCKSIGDAAWTQYSESVVGRCQSNVRVNLQFAITGSPLTLSIRVHLDQTNAGKSI